MAKKRKITIFTGKHKIGDDLAQKVKSKRIHYTDTKKHKNYENDKIDGQVVINDIDNYERLTACYQQLANIYPVFAQQSLFAQSNIGTLYYEDEEVVAYDYGLIRTWLNKYYKEWYWYQGKQYLGQEFEARTAEIIGTEDLNIQERLYIHETVLEMLEDGYNIDQLNWYIESLVNLFKQGWTANLYVLAMIMEGAKNPPNLDRKEDIMK